MQEKQIIQTKIRKRILQWRNDPVLYVQETLGATPTDQQRQILNAIVNYDFIAAKSGHGIGKTTVEAWIILWFLTCYTNARVPATAPTGNQLVRILWPEIRKWLQRSKLKGLFEWEKSKVYIKGEEEVCFAYYRAARSPEALAGAHEDNILYILEEASGIEDEIWEPVEGALTTKNAKAMACGNPTRPEGNFYRAFTDQSKFWHTFSFSSLDSPLVTPEYCERMRLKYGEDSDIYRIRVLGEFPKQASDTFIPLYLCERSLGFNLERDERFKLGVDVARFGDNYTVWLIRAGGVLLHMERKQTMDTMEVAGRTQQIMKDFNIAAENVSIDSVGVGGGVVDRLHELNVGVNSINVGEPPIDETQYKNKRVELWGVIKQELIEEKLNLSILNNGEMTRDLCGELASPKYKITSKGQYQLESKEDMKKRGVQSPDIADALALTYCFNIGEGVIMSAPKQAYPKNI